MVGALVTTILHDSITSTFPLPPTESAYSVRTRRLSSLAKDGKYPGLPRLARRALILAPIVLAAFAWYLFSSRPLDSDGADIEGTSTPSAETHEARGGRQALMAAALQRQLELPSREPSEEEETPVNIAELSEEEIRKRVERTKRTSPYYWKMAPEVFEEMLESQKTDTQWSARAETEVKHFLAQKEFDGTEVLETDCRETLCRMTLEHRDEDAYDAFKRNGAPDGPWLKCDIQGKRESLEGGGVKTSIYFSKQEDPRAFEEMRERLLQKVIAIEGDAPR